MGFWDKLIRRKNEGEDVMFLYGTKSGNSRLVAQKAQKYFQKNGIQASCANMASFKPEQLYHVQRAMLVVSTHGEGEPPPSAEKFFRELNGDDMLLLNHLSYSVCALGDKTYTEFCKAGIDLDKRLQKLGAKPILSRCDCDENFAEDAIKWIKESLLRVQGKESIQESSEDLSLASAPIYSAVVKERKLLTSSDEVEKVYHLVLAIGNDQVLFEPGDSVDILPRNPVNLVNDILQHLKVDECTEEGKLLKEQLYAKFEITSLNKTTLQTYFELSKSNKLKFLLQQSELLESYIYQANVLNLLKDFPYPISSQELLAIIPTLRSRKYSIASSLKRNKHEIHLCIKTIRFQYMIGINEGAGSVYTNEFLELGSRLQFRISKNEAFNLPEETKTPLLLIGVSTGIAPLRALLQEQEVCASKRDIWLIWGNKHNEKDFLYKEELEEYCKKGILKYFHTSFSKAEKEPNYVYQILEMEKEEVQSYIRKGAHLYVCGSISMSNSVQAKLNGIGETAGFSVQSLKDSGRWHEDVY